MKHKLGLKDLHARHSLNCNLPDAEFDQTATIGDRYEEFIEGGLEKLVLKGELSTNAVWAATNGGIAELLGIDSDAEGSLDTWAESLGVGQAEDTSAGNLSLDKCGLVEENLCTNFEVHAVGRRGRVIDGLGTGFDIGIYAMVVRGGEETHVAERVEGDSIIGSAITKSTGISRDSSVVDVVVGLGTQQEAVTGENDVASDIRTVEEVKAGPGVITWLLEGDVEQAAVDSLFGMQARVSFELKTLCELVFDLQLGAEDVVGRPRVREDSSIFWVTIFALEVTGDVTGLRVAGAIHTEGDIGGSLSLDFQANGVEWEIPTEEVA